MENNAIILKDAKNSQKYFAVKCKCGHVKTNRYVEIIFATKASNAKEASSKARYFGRVKHHKKDAIIDCNEITEKEYFEIIKNNSTDPYFKCKNIQEQRLIEGFESRIFKEPEITWRKDKNNRKDSIAFKLKKQKLILNEFKSLCAM